MSRIGRQLSRISVANLESLPFIKKVRHVAIWWWCVSEDLVAERFNCVGEEDNRSYEVLGVKVETEYVGLKVQIETGQLQCFEVGWSCSLERDRCKDTRMYYHL